MDLVDIIPKGSSNASSFPSIFYHNFFVSTNEIKILWLTLHREASVCYFSGPQKDSLEQCPMWSDSELARRTKFVLCFGRKIYMTCWLLRGWKKWSCYEELVPSFHDFFSIKRFTFSARCPFKTVIKSHTFIELRPSSSFFLFNVGSIY